MDINIWEHSRRILSIASTTDRLVSGLGKYVDDIRVENLTHAAFLRSPYAHARIRSIDLSGAVNTPGVFMALDGKSIDPHTRPLPVPVYSPRMKFTRKQQVNYSYLARDKVRYVGEPVAVVVAADRYIAEDAVERIVVDYESIDPVVDAEKDVHNARLYEDWPDNLYVNGKFAAGDYEAASKEADILLSDRIKMHRQSASPMETRGCLAQFDSNVKRLTFYCSSQNVHEQRLLLAYALNLSPSSMRVVAPDVGGGFGQKSHIFNEDVVIALSSMLVGRPVKWIESRYEHLLTCQAREQTHYIEIAAAKNGEIIGLKDKIVVDLGAAPINGHGGLYSGIVTLYTMTGPYHISNYDCELSAIVTNKAPCGAYRGYGQPEGTFALERMMDKLARETGIDAADVRIKNMIQDHEFPYVSATGSIMDSGQYVKCLTGTLDRIGYREFRRMQQAARTEGRYLGIGIGCYVKSSATPTKILLPIDDQRVTSGEFPTHVISKDGARVSIDGSGRARVYIAASSIGTGVRTGYVGIVGRELGIDAKNIDVILSDTENCPDFSGVYASRSTMIGGVAVATACTELRNKMISFVAESLGVPADTIYMREGEFRSKISAQTLRVEDVVRSQGDKPLEATGFYKRPVIKFPDGRTSEATGVFSNGTDVIMVEVDPSTFEVKILKYIVTHDAGPLMHKEIVDGQIIGGLAQGLGGCFYEEIFYDNQGQLLTASLMDYGVPTAAEVPNFDLEHISTPTEVGLYGSRSVGESGTAAVAAALAGAIEDALAPLSIRITETPLKPNYLFDLLKAATGK